MEKAVFRNLGKRSTVDKRKSMQRITRTNKKKETTYKLQDVKNFNLHI